MDPSIDRAEEIESQNVPVAPLQIIDLRAHVDKQYHSLLNVTFKLKNQSAKTVGPFDVLLYSDDKGTTELPSGTEVLPLSSLEHEITTSRYVYFCDGMKKHKFIVVSVKFADGSEWHQANPTLLWH